MNPERGGNTGSARLYGLVGIAVVLLLSGSVLLIWQVDAELDPKPVRSFEVQDLEQDDPGPGIAGWAGYLSAEEAIEFSGLKRGMVYDDVALEEAEERLALHPAVKAARIEQVGGGVVRIRLAERACVAVIRQEQSTEDENGGGPADGRTTLYEVDAELVILAENRIRCKDAPLVRGAFARDEEGLERFTDPALARVIAGLQDLRKHYPELADRISELHWRRTGRLTLYLKPARVRVELPGSLDSAGVVQRLYAAVAYFERSGGASRSGVIDLRGEGVVILPE